MGARLRVELYIDVGDITENKAIFDIFMARKDEIEREIGTPLEWEKLDQKRASRISLVRPDTTINDADDNAEELQAWLIQGLLKTKNAFGPLLKSAKQTASSSNQDDQA